MTLVADLQSELVETFLFLKSEGLTVAATYTTPTTGAKRDPVTEVLTGGTAGQSYPVDIFKDEVAIDKVNENMRIGDLMVMFPANNLAVSVDVTHTMTISGVLYNIVMANSNQGIMWELQLRGQG